MGCATPCRRNLRDKSGAPVLLYVYQWTMVMFQWLRELGGLKDPHAPRGGINADGMGLGKTMMTVAYGVAVPVRVHIGKKRRAAQACLPVLAIARACALARGVVVQ